MNARQAPLDEFRSRLAAFQESYSWEEPDGLLRAFALVGEMLSVAFDPATAARGMQVVQHLIKAHPDKPIDWAELDTVAPQDWRKTWADLDAFNETSWSSLMEESHNLNAFAFYSIIPSWDSPSMDRSSPEVRDVPGYVRGIVDRLARFVQLLPKSLEFYGVDSIERTCLAATGRLKIDLNEALTVHELAALTQVTTKRLQNAIYAKSAEAPIVGRNGAIPAAGAQRWLEARNYMRSIWQEVTSVNGWEGKSVAESATPHEDADGDFFFVPEARDGTIFSPLACKRGGTNGGPRYTIGSKGSELDFEQYEKALAALSRMTTPRWRRPNENGNFGIVTAERWRRLTRDELLSM